MACQWAVCSNQLVQMVLHKPGEPTREMAADLMTREEKPVSARGWDFAAHLDATADGADQASELSFVREIDELRSLHERIRADGLDPSVYEKAYTRIAEILELYQEQSHLLDRYLEELVTPLLLKMFVLCQPFASRHCSSRHRRSPCRRERLQEIEMVRKLSKVVYVWCKVSIRTLDGPWVDAG